VVFLLNLLAVVFVTVVPDGTGARAVTFALVGTAVIVVVGTSRERTMVLRRRTAIASMVVLGVTVAIAAGALDTDATFLLSAAMVVAVPVSLSRGLLRLVRERGATGQAVAGGLAIYLSIGLAFAFAIGFVAVVGSGHYFAQGTSGSASDRVYYSFTVLTTTGFGDLTAAHGAGRALAVIEMLTGQLYLVTVVGVLVGLRVGRRN
jgi:Ion channel